MTRPPLRLHATIEAPNGTTYRWGLDDPNPENVPANITFSTTMPGGFEQASMTLPRQPAIDYPDLTEFSTITVRGAGGQVAWQGRLETTPRTSGTQLAITPGAVGWQAALDDDQSARMIFVDIDMTKWQGASVARKAALKGASVDYQDGQVIPGPSIQVGLLGNFARARESDLWYDAKGIPIAGLAYAWNISGETISPADTHWHWSTYLCDDNQASHTDGSGELRAAGPGSGLLSATVSNRTWAFVNIYYDTAWTFGDGQTSSVFYNVAAVYGYAVPLRGSLTTTSAYGVLASEVVQYAVNRWAPQLATSRAGGSTLEPSTFIIPHLVFTDPTTASNIIKQAIQYGLPDWWVDNGDHDQPTFNLASRANHGQDWQARVGPSGLQETGPQVDRLYNSVVVSFNDVDGTKLTVGPTGSGANTIDDTLADSDPSNPVTAAGLTRRFELDIGIVSTVAAATLVGQTWLAEQKLLSTAGQAQLVGHVQDTSGIWHPAWQVRAGDRITFVDAHDPVPRRIVRTSYTDATKTNQLDLDSPPQGLQAMLARFTAADTSLGL